MVGFLNTGTRILGIQVKTTSLTFHTGIALAATDSEFLILKFGWGPFMLTPLIALFAFICVVRSEPTVDEPEDPATASEDRKDPRRPPAEWDRVDALPR